MRAVLLGIALLGWPLSLAGQKTTTLRDAQASIEANLHTAEGKAYDAKFGTAFLRQRASDIRACKKSAAGDLRNFWLLFEMKKDGTPEQLLFQPETKLAICARSALLHAKYPPPPHSDYWVSVYLKLAH